MNLVEILFIGSLSWMLGAFFTMWWGIRSAKQSGALREHIEADITDKRKEELDAVLAIAAQIDDADTLEKIAELVNLDREPE